MAAGRDIYFRGESAELVIGVFVAQIARVVGYSGYVSVLVVFVIKLICSTEGMRHDLAVGSVADAVIVESTITRISSDLKSIRVLMLAV